MFRSSVMRHTPSFSNGDGNFRGDARVCSGFQWGFMGLLGLSKFESFAAAVTPVWKKA